MKIIFAQYEHSTLGFPKVLLKWHEVKGRKHLEPYVTENGLIVKPWEWSEEHAYQDFEKELERFDDWVRSTYSENSSVQG